MDSLASIRAFVEVARQGSFSAVARERRVATSSVTRQINALESSLGVRLLNRTTRQLSLTDVGQVFLQHAMRIVADAEEAQRAVGDLQDTPRGTLRVSAPVVFGRLQVAAAVTEFLGRFPEIRVELSLNDHFVNLVEESIDVAIRIADLPDSTLVARKLMGMERMICASPAYLEARGRPERPESLEQHNCLTVRSHVTNELWRPSSSTWHLEAPDGSATTVNVSGNLQTNNADVLLRAAREGLGLILVPDWMALPFIAQGELVPVLDGYRPGTSGSRSSVYAVYPSSRYLSPKVRVLIDFMAEWFSGVERACSHRTAAAG